MLLTRCLIGAVLLFAISPTQAQSDRESWYFTAHEIEIAYRYQETVGKRLYPPLRPKDCFFGKKEFVASYQGKEFLAPCRFIHETIRHLKEILERGAAKYFFPLDADHAHLAIPSNIWEKRYKKLPGDKILPVLLQEAALVALYHTAEHLTIADPKTGKVNPDAKAWREKRNVLGFYDGRPISILSPDPMGSGYSEPGGYGSCATFYFLANRIGELSIVVGGKPISFDISFDNDLAVNVP